jgi:hypothetical protein
MRFETFCILVVIVLKTKTMRNEMCVFVFVSDILQFLKEHKMKRFVNIFNLNILMLFSNNSNVCFRNVVFFLFTIISFHFWFQFDFDSKAIFLCLLVNKNKRQRKKQNKQSNRVEKGLRNEKHSQTLKTQQQNFVQFQISYLWIEKETSPLLRKLTFTKLKQISNLFVNEREWKLKFVALLTKEWEMWYFLRIISSVERSQFNFSNFEMNNCLPLLQQPHFVFVISDWMQRVFGRIISFNSRFPSFVSKVSVVERFTRLKTQHSSCIQNRMNTLTMVNSLCQRRWLCTTQGIFFIWLLSSSFNVSNLPFFFV